MRLAGTCRQYSKKAIPQLTSTTFHSASCRYFRWPYQAVVMKMLDPSSSKIVFIVPRGRGLARLRHEDEEEQQGGAADAGEQQEGAVIAEAGCDQPRQGGAERGAAALHRRDGALRQVVAAGAAREVGQHHGEE